MVSICTCETCQKIKAVIEERKTHPLCSYCGKIHGPGLVCLNERAEKTAQEKLLYGGNKLKFHTYRWESFG